MSETKTTTTIPELLKDGFPTARQDRDSPQKKQEDIVIDYPSDNEGEDENTLAKSLIDEIIEETESSDK